MKHHLNIIKIVIFSMGFSSSTWACSGCDFKFKLFSTDTVNSNYDDSATAITDRFDDLADTESDYYNDNIKPLINTINDIQADITQMVVHIKALEKDANLDERKLLYLLGKTLNKKKIFSLKKVMEAGK